MAEVLGTVLASTQVLGMVVSILAAIDQVRDSLQDGPKRLQSWHTELVLLEATIECVRQNESLQTTTIESILEAIAQKILAVSQLLAKNQLPSLPKRSVKTMLKALVGSLKSAESRILQRFIDIERDKATLILAIHTTYGSILSNSLGDRGGQAMATRREVTPMGDSSSWFLSAAEAQQLLQFERFQQLIRQHSIEQPASLHRLPAQLQQMAHSQVPPRPFSYEESRSPRDAFAGQESGVSVFTNIHVEGDDNLVGGTTGRGGREVKFEGVGVKGSRDVVGLYTTEAIVAFRQGFNAPPSGSRSDASTTPTSSASSSPMTSKPLGGQQGDRDGEDPSSSGPSSSGPSSDMGEPELMDLSP